MIFVSGVHEGDVERNPGDSKNCCGHYKKILFFLLFRKR